MGSNTRSVSEPNNAASSYAHSASFLIKCHPFDRTVRPYSHRILSSPKFPLLPLGALSAIHTARTSLSSCQSPPFSPLGPCRPHLFLRTSLVPDRAALTQPTIPARSPPIGRTSPIPVGRTSITRPVPTDEPPSISIGTIFSSSPTLGPVLSTPFSPYRSTELALSPPW